MRSPSQSSSAGVCIRARGRRFAQWAGLATAFLAILTARVEIHADEFDDLRLKWRDIIVGAGYDLADPQVGSLLNSVANSANSYWNSMDKSPDRTFLWSDAASATISSHVSNSYNRLRSMALAYATPGCSLEGDSGLLADLIAALDWMEANRYSATTAQYGNWWDWEIGSPLRLTDICVLLYDQLTPERLTAYMDAVNHQTPIPDMTQANQVWKARVVGVRGCLVKDGAKIALSRNAFSDVFPYVVSGDGFYADGSFIQHNYHPYTAGYGAALLDNMAPVLNWLAGSSWEITDPAQANVWRWVFESYEPIIYRGSSWDLVRGREAGRKNASPHSNGHGIMNSILQLAQFAPEAEARRMKSMLKYWTLSGTVRDFVKTRPLATLPLARQIMTDDSIEPRGELIAHYTFPAMDRVIHLGRGYGFGISMSSSRIARFESINGENLHGWFTGDGMTALRNNDQDHFGDGYWPVIDAYRMPGVTADSTHGKLPHDSSSLGPRAKGQSSRPAHDWAGGATLGAFGSAGMQLDGWGVTLTAKKSWFMFDDEVVCLGSGVTSSDNRPIETTVENRRLSAAGDNLLTLDGVAQPSDLDWTASPAAVHWAHLAGTAAGADIGYYFPDGTPLTVVREARTASEADIDSDGSTTPITSNFLRLTVEHGSNPVDAGYQYVLLPGRNARRCGHYAENPQVQVLANDGDVQAVEETTLGITAANFWNDAQKTAGILGANRKCSALARVDGAFVEVAVSDPTQLNNDGIELEIAAEATATVRTDPGVTVVSLSPTIKLRIDTANSRGRTFTARFYRGTPRALSAPPSADAYVYDAVASQDVNFGSASTLVVKKSGDGYNREAFLKFDIPQVDGLLLAANLKLTARSAAEPGEHAVALIDDNNWTESGVTWDNKPAESGLLPARWVPETGATVSVDVSAAIDQAGPRSFGIRAVTQTANGYVTYASKELGTAAERPSLELLIGDLPPEVSLTQPPDGAWFNRVGEVTLAADAASADGSTVSVSFYDGEALLGMDATPPFSLTPSLGGGAHFLKAVAVDSDGQSRASLVRRIDIAHPPTAAHANVTTRRGIPVEIDLAELAGDVETPVEKLRFAVGSAEHGEVALLTDGHTARFTPAEGHSGPAAFTYSTFDRGYDEAAVFHYDFTDDTRDASGRGLTGSVQIEGAGSADYDADLPPPLRAEDGRSLVLTEDNANGAARLERLLDSGIVQLAEDDWTIAGWFKRGEAADIDGILQLGSSGGWASSAMTLAFYGGSSQLTLRNYNGSTLDAEIRVDNVAAGAWHHFAVVREGEALSLYLDGALAGADSDFTFSFDNRQPVGFGGMGAAGASFLNRWLNGSLADLTMFTRPLSGGEVTRLFRGPVAMFAGQTASARVDINIPHPPIAAPLARNAQQDAPHDIDLRTLVTDADTAMEDLRFSVGDAANGSVSLLPDGHTARFTPAPGRTGAAGFNYAVLDATPDERMFLHWRLAGTTFTDASGNGRNATPVIQGAGSLSATAEAPPALAPQQTHSLAFTENGTVGAARLEIDATELDPLNRGWTITGWFRRNDTDDIDSVLQLGESGGWGPNALSLVLPAGSGKMQLRNYAGDTRDVVIETPDVPVGSWRHFAVVREDGAIRLYLDGALAGEDSDFEFTFNAAKPLKLGGVVRADADAYWNRWFRGDMADFAIFNAALSDGEIALLQSHPADRIRAEAAGASVAFNLIAPVDSWRERMFEGVTELEKLADDADPDGDGLTNLAEYILGDDPLTPGSRPGMPAIRDGMFSLEFRARRATGDGYLGLTRRYTLESSAELLPFPVWQPVPGFEDIAGDDQDISFAAVPDGIRRFFRLRVRLAK